MKTYIVFDLEWNQSPKGKTESVEGLPFEIFEIGAVKLDEDFRMLGEFHRLIRPQVYTQMHYVISEVTHVKMSELQQQDELFPKAAEEFFEWCGEEASFCTWGNMDLTELQRNMDYYGMENPFPYPLYYYDVQKLYSLYHQKEVKLSLDAAVEEQQLLEERPFHRALDDAYYTGKLLATMAQERILPYVSVDYHRLPEREDEEIRIQFPEYTKYVSRIYPSKEDAMAVRLVTEMKCRICGRTLRKKVRWFTPNQRIYYALAWCPEHGYLKGKIRMKKVDDTRVFAVKTLKFTDEEGARCIQERKEEVARKRSEKNRMKKHRKK